MKKTLLAAVVLIFSLCSLSALQNQETVDPVNWRELVPFLIDLPGWQAKGDAEGSTMSMGDFKMSQAERGFTAGEKSLKVQLVDGGFAPMVYMGLKMAMNMEIDTSDEYVKKCTVNGVPGIEKYDFEDEEAQVILLIADRFLLTLSGENMTDQEAAALKQTAEALDMKGIAGLGK